MIDVKKLRSFVQTKHPKLYLIILEKYFPKLTLTVIGITITIGVYYLST